MFCASGSKTERGLRCSVICVIGTWAVTSVPQSPLSVKWVGFTAAAACSCRDARLVTAERLERHQRSGCTSRSGRVVAPWQRVCLLMARPLPFRRRFEFLQPWHQYNAYYEFKKQFFLQKEGGDSAQVRLRLLWPAHYRHRSACSRPWGLWVWRLIAAGLMHAACCLTFPPPS